MTGDLTLTCQTKTYIEVQELRLAEFVTAVYGKPWSMQQGEMLGQDTHRIVEVDDDDEVDGFYGITRQKMQAWLDLPAPTDGDGVEFMREHYCAVELILNDLCRRGLIEAGEYLIRVEW